MSEVNTTYIQLLFVYQEAFIDSLNSGKYFPSEIMDEFVQILHDEKVVSEITFLGSLGGTTYVFQVLTNGVLLNELELYKNYKKGVGIGIISVSIYPDKSQIIIEMLYRASDYVVKNDIKTNHLSISGIHSTRDFQYDKHMSVKNILQRRDIIDEVKSNVTCLDDRLDDYSIGSSLQLIFSNEIIGKYRNSK